MKNNLEIFMEDLRRLSKDFEQKMDPFERKRTGSYYTDLSLTDVMMSELVHNIIASGKNITECSFLEPCVGTGNFVFSYLKQVNALNLRKEDNEKILKNIYVSDVNKEALSEYKTMLKKFAKSCWNISLNDSYFKNNVAYGLLVNLSEDTPKYIGLEDAFSKKIALEKFDIIATNPPYKNIKAERTHYKTSLDYAEDKQKYENIKKIIRNKLKYSSEGVINIYRAFVEEVIDTYSKKDAFISILIPASILSDKSSHKIRTHILEDENLISVRFIPEGSGYIDAQQALCAMLIEKGKKTKNISVYKNFKEDPSRKVIVNVEDIFNSATGNSIVAISEQEYKLLRNMRKFPSIRDLGFIKNLRGELDLTLNKKDLSEQDTGYPFLRGRNIGFYEIIDIDRTEFASTAFVRKTSKTQYIERERIVCQQIANMHKDHRVTFAFVPKNHVLGNSCNFIAVEENLYGIDIYSLLGLLNTKIIDWFFRLTSSNNHINNYEIASFPIPIGSQMLKEISLNTQKFLKTRDKAILQSIENCARRAFGISGL